MCLRDLLVVVVRKLRRMMGRTKQEEEYLSSKEKLNLEELWKAAFKIGTSWDQLDKFNEFNWDFKTLEEALEEGGILYGKQIYVFCSTEPELLFSYKDAKEKIVEIPTVVAIVSPFPPSDKIGIASLQSGEIVVPMKQMKMEWLPFGKRIFYLGCTQARAALSLRDLKNLEYCLPYFYDPFKEDELEHSTVVNIFFPSEPPVLCEFDWELDELEEFVDELIQEEELSWEQRDQFKGFVKEHVQAAKKANGEAKDARKKEIEEMNEDTKQAFESIKFYKFYPQLSPDVPKFKKIPRINRYYGEAHHVL